MGLLRLRSVFGLCAIFVFVILAHDIEHRSGVFRFAVYNSLSGPLAVVRVRFVPVPARRSAFFPFVEHNSLFGPLVPVPVPLVPVPACEYVEQTS